MRIKDINAVKSAGSDIVKIMSGGVLLWTSEALIKEQLAEAAKHLQIQDFRGNWYGGEGLTEIYNVYSNFKILPYTVDGYDVDVTYKSENPYYLSDQGVVHSPGGVVKKVMLYATITYRGTNQSITKNFLVYIV